MVGVLIGFAIIAFVIGVGYAIGRSQLLGPDAVPVLSRLSFFVLSPALLFTVLAEADVAALFSELLPTTVSVAALALVVFALVAVLLWRRAVPEATIGSLSSAYANAMNMGLPLSAYVLGDAAASAPVFLLQLLVITPIALTILDLSTGGRPSIGRILLQPVRNPLIIASALGFVIAVTGVEVPPEVFRPFELIGGAAVPVILVAFGMSLHGTRLLAPGEFRKDTILASALKLVFMPLAAWVVGRFVFGLDDEALFAAVILMALPTGQNVFNYAHRYRRGEVLARDVVFITTVGSFPAMLIVAALLAPR
jgi:malonate transporter